VPLVLDCSKVVFGERHITTVINDNVNSKKGMFMLIILVPNYSHSPIKLTMSMSRNTILPFGFFV